MDEEEKPKAIAMKNAFQYVYRLASAWSLALAASLVLGTPAVAEEAQDLDKQVTKIDQASKETGASEADLEAVSKATNVPVEELERQQAKTKAGPGSLLIANSLAAKTGQSFDDIMAAKSSGKGWGQIAKENNVKLGPLMKEAKQVDRAQQKHASAKKAQGESGRQGHDQKAGQAGARDSKGQSAGKKGKEEAAGKKGQAGGKGKKGTN